MMNFNTLSNLPDLAQAFKPQEELAQQAADSNEQIAQQITTAAVDPNKQAAAMARMSGMQPDIPQLKFGVDANSVGEGVVQGLGNATNNFIAMKNYNQQRRMVQDLANVYQSNLAQQQATANAAVQRDQEFEAGLPENLRPVYHNLNEAGRKKFQETYGSGEVDLYQDPRRKAAEGQADFQAKLQNINAIREMGMKTYDWDIANPPKDRQTPAGLMTIMNSLGVTNENIHDAVTQGVVRNKAVVQANQAGASVAEPQQAIENLKATKLSNIANEIKNFFDPVRMRLDIEGKGYDNITKLQKLNELANAAKVYQGMMDKMARGEQLTPQDFTMASMTLNFLANHDPKIGEVMRQFAGVKEGKPITQKDIEKVFTGVPISGGISSEIPLPAMGAQVTSPDGQTYTHLGNGQFKGSNGQVYDANQMGPTQAPTTAPAAKPKTGKPKTPADLSGKSKVQVPTTYHGQPVIFQNGNAIIGKGHMVNGQMRYNTSQYMQERVFHQKVADEQRFKVLKEKSIKSPNSFTQPERDELFRLARQYAPDLIKVK